jgi:hypothetical protein
MPVANMNKINRNRTRQHFCIFLSFFGGILAMFSMGNFILTLRFLRMLFERLFCKFDSLTFADGAAAVADCSSAVCLDFSVTRSTF